MRVVDLKTDLHIVANIPQSCDCAETLCVKLLTQDELSRLTTSERTRIWTLRSLDDKNWLDYGVSNARNIKGYILMPLRVKLPDTVEEEEVARAWTCPGCGHEVEKTYTEFVDEGKPHCDDCNQDMELVRPADPEAEAAAAAATAAAVTEAAEDAPATDDAPANETANQTDGGDTTTARG